MPKKYEFTKTFTFDGKRYYVRGDSEEDCIAKMALKKRDLEEGRKVLTSNTTVRDWSKRCIETYKTNQMASTRAGFERVVQKHILAYIGDYPIQKVRPVDCQDILNKVEGNSNRHINSVYHALRFLFKYARINRLINEDPTEGLQKPRGKSAQSYRALTPDEREIIISEASKDRRYYSFLRMLFCGCRPAEATECKGSDLQKKNGVNILHIRGTKTALSDRIVPVPDVLYEIIKNTPADEYICLSEGSKQVPSRRTSAWHSLVRNINIALGCKMYRNQLIGPLPFPDDIVPYCLRHEYCTDLARKGIDIRVAQQLMGHSTIDLTANIYTNLSHDEIIQHAALLGAT